MLSKHFFFREWGQKVCKTKAPSIFAGWKWEQTLCFICSGLWSSQLEVLLVLSQVHFVFLGPACSVTSVITPWKRPQFQLPNRSSQGLNITTEQRLFLLPSNCFSFLLEHAQWLETSTYRVLQNLCTCTYSFWRWKVKHVAVEHTYFHDLLVMKWMLSLESGYNSTPKVNSSQTENTSAVIKILLLYYCLLLYSFIMATNDVRHKLWRDL